MPSENISTTTNSRDGTTTTYLVPTPQLPLTHPLRTVLPDQTVDRVDEVLRPVVDAGYSRHDDPDAVIKRPVLSGGKITLPSDTKTESTSTTKAEITTTAKTPKNTVRSLLSGKKPASTTHKKPANPVRNLVKKVTEGHYARARVGTGRRLSWPRSITRRRAS